MMGSVQLPEDMQFMPDSLRAKANEMLSRYRQQDLDREGGPHLFPYELQHTVRVFYPDPKYLKNHEVLAEPVPDDFTHMYNPLDPLVEDEEAMQNAGHSLMKNNSFVSHYRASRYGTQENTVQEFDGVHGFITPRATFVHALTQLERLVGYSGHSSFHFTPFKKKNDPASEASLKLRMIVESTIDTWEGTLNCRTVEIVAPFAALYQQMCSDQNRAYWPWARDLYDLVTGLSLRAIRHRLLLKAHPYERIQPLNQTQIELRAAVKEQVEHDIATRYNFRPRRRPQYAMMYQHRRVNYLNIPQGSRQCGTCWDEFGPDSNKVPLAYPCGNHYICEDCLVLTCETVGPEPDKAKCGLDQTPCFQPWELEYLKWGVMNGVFNPATPSRFEDWEDVQRANADLDQYLCDSHVTMSNGTKIKDFELVIRPGMLFSIWLDMIKLDDQFPESDRHRPALFPELREIMIAVWHAISTMKGRRHAVGNLPNLISCKIENALVKKACERNGTSPGDVMFGGTEQQALWMRTDEWLHRDDRLKLQIYRDGVLDFIDRTLNRTFQFCRLRLCPDQGHVLIKVVAGLGRDEPWAERNHQHGMRDYYHDLVYARLFPGDNVQPGRLGKVSRDAWKDVD